MVEIILSIATYASNSLYATALAKENATPMHKIENQKVEMQNPISEQSESNVTKDKLKNMRY